MLPRLLAEGLVIIVGVLVALAVDRAATRVDERSLEREYLSGVAADLESLAAATRHAASEARRRDEAARVVLAAVRGRSPANTSGIELARALVMAGFVPDQPFARETWDDIVGTGRVYVLRDEELRRRIRSFYRQTDQMQTFNEDWVRTARDYQAAVQRILEPEIVEAVYLELIYATSAADSISLQPSQIIGEMRGEPELLPMLSSILLINPVAAQSYEALSALATSLASDITATVPAS
jgi:hypothetical protein